MLIRLLVLAGALLSTSTVPPAYKIALVSFPTRDAGFAFTDSGRELSSHDAGKSWQLLRTGVRLSSVDFVSLRLGFGLTAQGELLATRDGGHSWIPSHHFPFSPAEVTGPAGATIDFLDGRVGYIASGSTPIFRTSDGGRTWRTLSFRCAKGGYLGGVAFANRRLGFAACGERPATSGQYRTYATTADGGRTWRRGSRSFASGFVSELAYPAPAVRFVYAERFGISHPNGKALLATDGDQVTSMSWPSATRGYAVLFHGGLRRTGDGGRHWERPLITGGNLH